MMCNKLLAQLHIARKDMALEEESYRALLYRVTGQTSANGVPWFTGWPASVCGADGGGCGPQFFERAAGQGGD